MRVQDPFSEAAPAYVPPAASLSSPNASSVAGVPALAQTAAQATQPMQQQQLAPASAGPNFDLV
jgi:hypothetical protein